MSSHNSPKLLLLPFLIFQLIASQAFAAGMLWSDEDLAAWRTRSIEGPYIKAGDAFDPLIPGEWERIVESANTFRSNPQAERKSSYYVSDSSAGAAAPNYVLNHMEMLDAAFYALVKEDTALARAVKDELVWHSQQSSLQISPTLYQKTDFGNWWNAAWLLRMVMCADFVKEQFNAAELASFNAWVLNWAQSYESSIHFELSDSLFGNRYQRDYSNNLGWAATSPDYNTYAYKDGSGVKHNQIAAVHRRYNNRKAMVIQFTGIAGIWLNDPVLIDRSKLFFEEWLKFSVFPDGSAGEFERNSTSRSVQQGMNYNSTTIAAAICLADAMARQGDTSLYEFSTREGRYGTESESGEGAKSLRLVVDTYFEMIEYKKDWYLEDGQLTEPYRIDAVSDIGSMAGTQWISEIYFAPIANRYWKDQDIKKSYMRQASGSIAYSSPLGSAGPYRGPWRSQQAVYPSLLFMFSEMEQVTGSYPTKDEGVVDPAPTPDPDVPVEGEPPYQLVYATNYNYSNYQALDGFLLESPVYVAVKPADTVQSVIFYDEVNGEDVYVNTENYGPFDYIKQNVPLSPEDIPSGERVVVAVVTETNGTVRRITATVRTATAGVPPVVETDNDRLPDDWEIEHFGGINVKNGGESEDFDGDGVSNYDEYLAGTNPADVVDALTLEPVLAFPGQVRQAVNMSSSTVTMTGSR